MGELLRVESLSAGYSGKKVLEDMSFSVNAGELCALLGANGSGKSTLLRAVCGLLPYEGSCRMEGREVREMRERERAKRISCLTQRGGVRLPLSVLDVVLMGFNPLLGLLENPGKSHRQKARECLALAGVEELAERDFLTLSEGQRQMVLLARAFVRDCPLLVLDEPDSALDFQNRHRMMALLSRLCREKGMGVLLCSHDANFAMEYADRLLLLHQGRLVGDLSMGTVAVPQLESALSQLYGPVEVLEHRGLRIMIKGETG